MIDDLLDWGAAQPVPVRAAQPVVTAPLFPPEPELWNGVRHVNGRAVLHKRLRSYQEEIREAVHGHFQTAGRALVVAATGGGKTICFAAIAADTEGRTLILTDQELLVDQAIEKILDVTGIYADAEQAHRSASIKARVVVATVQSMRERLGKYPKDHFKLVICDECDRSVSEQWRAVLEHFKSAKLLGVTATPNRTDKKTILRTFETKVYEIGMLELIRRGFLAPVTVETVPLNIDLTGAETPGGDFDETKVGHAVVKVFGEVCKAIKERAAGRKILVFCPDRATSRKFVEACHRAELNARHIDGESRDQAETKRDFRNGAFQILSNPMLLNRGYDEPSIDCIINLRFTNSESLYQQIIGRGTRLFCPRGCGGPCDHQERKRDVKILDFLAQFKEMGPVRPCALIADTPAKRAAISRMQDQGGTLDLCELEERATRDIEAAMIKAFQEAQRKTRGKPGEYFNAVHWAANLHITDLLDYQPETDRESEPVPDKLKKKLTAAGFIPESVACLGHAERILAVLAARKEAGLASMKQIFWLRKWGYRDPFAMRAEEAKSILAKRFYAEQKFGR